MRVPSFATAASNSLPLIRAVAQSRAAIFVPLALIEVLLASLLIEIPPREGIWPWQNPVAWANTLATIAVTAGALLVVTAWPRRRQLIEDYRIAAASSPMPAIAGNIILFVALTVAGLELSTSAAPGLSVLIPYAVLLLAAGSSLVFVLAPPRFWWWTMREIPGELAAAVAGGGFAVLFGKLAQHGWHVLSDATLTLSAYFLSLYEANIFVDSHERVLGVGTFGVRLEAQCSGYEGVSLMAAFMAGYIWAFRRSLRFPNVLLLFPIGIATIWVMNALRIALLVSVGAHISPTIAVQGFHSQAGWVAFIVTALGVIAISQKSAFFSDTPSSPAPPSAGPSAAGAKVTFQYLGPFMALLVSTVVASAFAPYEYIAYPLRVVTIAGVLWWWRSAYLPLLRNASPLSAVVGLLVGVGWIWTAPVDAHSAIGEWISSLPLGLAVAWLVCRMLGSIVLVPMAEELAFRGYLARALSSARFEELPIGTFRIVGFMGSSLAFGLIHQRWIAASLAGMVYALLMYRSKRLSDPIAAHVATNAAIMAWALAMGQWSLM